MAKTVGDTPLMQQHRAIKQKYPDAVLLFRVGDFYETFGQDAITASQVLGITLTKRNNGAAASSELAGFPHHALDTYLHKLVKAGYRVAICDQLEDPKTVKGIVKRGVTEMVTPGVATNDKLLEHNSNNFLAAVHFTDQGMGLALLDISTGEFFVAEGDTEYVDKLLQTFKPSEVILQRNFMKQFKDLFGIKFYTYTLENWIFDVSFATEQLTNHFQTHSLKGFGVEGMFLSIVAAGAIMHYLKETEHTHVRHITHLQRLERDDYLWMDRFTIRNLEILQTGITDSYSLVKVMDQTVSPMGARLLKRWLVMPLRDISRINERLDIVAYFIRDTDLRKQLQLLIRQCGDVERLVAKIPLKKINPREVLHIAKGLQHTIVIKKLLAEAADRYANRLADTLNGCPYILEKILAEMIDTPPVSTQKGGVIKSGVHTELDELRNIASGGKEYLLEIQQEEAKRTGISSLKIGFNNVFGYYLEVTHAHKDKVPPEWIRKQTLTNAERYITPLLKEYEEKITGAEDKILAIENDLFEKLLTELQDYISPIQVNGNIMAIVDVLLCFADNALKYNYRRPTLHDGLSLEITEGRHPVIERFLPPGEPYISNNLTLDPDSQQIIILTGPNMSGKSALLRQAALITLMAHAGSFVPVEQALVPLTDKIFTRVGANDNLSGGESTFMVEMNESASIVNNISTRSLVLLDEIGRGTSTYDGISIAWSMVEYLHGQPTAPKTLFATHYHELNELENQLPRVKNYHITNKEVGNKIIFLRKMAPGGSRHSFGIHVARMAGMPHKMIDRADEILRMLENARTVPDSQVQQPVQAIKNITSSQIQLSIFDAHSERFETMRRILEAIDINRLTPVEALLKLNEIKALLG
jgi:DNA mismatch repair protein MutS